MQQSTMELLWRSSHIAGGNADLRGRPVRGLPAAIRTRCRRSGATISTSCRRSTATVRCGCAALHRCSEHFAQLERQNARAHGSDRSCTTRGQHRVRAQAGARGAADHRLSPARPPEGQSRSARAGGARARAGPRSRRSTSCRQPISTRCSRPARSTSARPRRRCARSSRRSSAPIAARSARSSCTSSTPSERHWISSGMEAVRSAPEYDAATCSCTCCERLTAAEGLEKFLASQAIRAPSASGSKAARA